MSPIGFGMAAATGSTADLANFRTCAGSRNNPPYITIYVVNSPNFTNSAATQL